MSDPIYRPSYAEQVIYLRRPVATATFIGAFGSADGYAEPHDTFGTDESIVVAGSVVPADGMDVRAGTVEISVNGGVVGVAGWIGFDADTGENLYSYTIGVLAEGDYTVRADFLRLRI